MTSSTRMTCLLMLGLFLAEVAGIVLIVANARLQLAAQQQRELSDQARSASAALGRSTESPTTILGRIRDSNQLTSILLLDRQRRILADPAGGEIGRIASPLMVDVQAFDRLPPGSPLYQQVELPGDPVCRVLIAAPQGILQLEATDRLPELFSALTLATVPALVIALSISLVGGLFLMRIFHQRERVARLATVGKLAASMAHEVKNPLGIVLSTVQLLRSEPQRTPDEVLLMDGLIEEIRRADDHLNGFLDLAREMPIRPQPSSLLQQARQVQSLLAARARESQVVIELDDQSDALGLIDPRRYRQALVNVVLNAVQAQPGGGSVRLRIAQVGSSAVCEVSDAGPGIPPAMRRHLGEPFVTGRSDGTGLGLWLVASSLAAVGGKVTFDCPAAGGTIVRLEVPCAS